MVAKITPMHREAAPRPMAPRIINKTMPVSMPRGKIMGLKDRPHRNSSKRRWKTSRMPLPRMGNLSREVISRGTDGKVRQTVGSMKAMSSFS